MYSLINDFLRAAWRSYNKHAKEKMVFLDFVFEYDEYLFKNLAFWLPENKAIDGKRHYISIFAK